MSQMVNLLTEQNVTASLASLSDRDILIRPELKDYTSADLDKSREIIAVGEANNVADAAQRSLLLAVRNGEHGTTLAHRVSSTSTEVRK